MSANGAFQRSPISSPDLVNLGAAFQEDKSWHCGDRVLLGNLARGIYVAFQKVDILVLPRKGLECRSNGMTRATPRRVEVNYSKFVLGLGQDPVQLGEGGDVGDGHRAHSEHCW